MAPTRDLHGTSMALPSSLSRVPSSPYIPHRDLPANWLVLKSSSSRRLSELGAGGVPGCSLSWVGQAAGLTSCGSLAEVPQRLFNGRQERASAEKLRFPYLGLVEMGAMSAG